ncbi:MAG: hypothetical protein HYU37_03165 [Acidobacteria bacterium]|nr:hypothetical protein [Acidobacteriota bacterium]
MSSRARTHEQPEHIPALQGGRAPVGQRLDVLQTNWAPATRVLVGGAGMALAVAGAVRRDTRGTLAAMGLGTSLTRYCPINQAMGRYPEGESPLEQGMRDTELRRQTAMASVAPRAATHARTR